MSKENSGTTMTPLQKAFTTISALNARLASMEQNATQPIAVVGLACKAPGAENAEALWQLLAEGRSAMQEVPVERWDINRYFDPKPGIAGKSCTRQGGFIDGVAEFDPDFFGISKREAEGMDPQQRLLLECTWHCFENAGIRPSTLRGESCGVFVGVTATDYGMLQADPDNNEEVNPYFNTGTPINVCAGRISYTFGLLGPSMAVDTACSSSLTAIHLACQSLRSGESNLAIAGGVNLTLTPLLYSTLSAAGMLSVDGQCKSFDESANGYARGEGCGVLALKRLSDAERDGDHILGTILGSTLNQDGPSSGLTTPNGVAQQRLLEETLLRSRVSAADIDYVEAHGTGTPLGDPIEARALGRVLGKAKDRTEPLLIGSIKSNIGHLESAAGVISVIKVLLSLEHETLPPTLHLKNPNREIDWENLNVQPVTTLRDWKRNEQRARRAGISGFGASGSNAHLILQEAARYTPPEVLELAAPILPLSANSPGSLRALAATYAERISQQTEPAVLQREIKKIAVAAACTRDALALRAAIVASSKETTLAALRALHSETQAPALEGPHRATEVQQVAFVFSGQGDVFPGMGMPLYQRFTAFRDAIDACDNHLGERVGPRLRTLLAADNQAMPTRASWSQPALFALQYALLKLWESVGIKPSAVIGHSIGEYAAAVAAGGVSLQDAMDTVVHRASLLDGLAQPGSMIAVLTERGAIENTLKKYSLESVSIAVENTPNNFVLAGSTEDLTLLQSDFEAQQIRVVPLTVTHGFHSKLMEPILAPFLEKQRGMTADHPKIPYFSPLAGRRLNPDELLDAQYWQRHCRETVSFSTTVSRMLDAGYRHFIEIGPANTMANLIQSISDAKALVISTLSSRSDDAFEQAVASAWVNGFSVDWETLPGYQPDRALKLPLYPFEKQRYWIKSSTKQTDISIHSSPTMTAQEPSAPDRAAILGKLLELFSGLLRLPADAIDATAQLIEMGADSLVLVSGVNAIENEFGVKLEIRQLFEEVTTIEAIADYLNANERLRMQTSVVSQTAAAIPASSSSSHTSGAALPGSLHNATTTTLTGSTELSQLIAAQAQLMAQQLELLKQLSGNGPSTAPTPSLPPASRSSQSNKAPNASDDRSSPLRALNQPLNTVSTLNAQQQAHMDALIARYQKRTPKSKQLAQACRPHLADSRASVGFRFSTKEILYPITGVDSTGSHVQDVDGNDYIDLTMGFGVLLFGSKPAHMQGILEEELQHGFQLGPRSDKMLEISELFCELSGHERVAFTNSGTESVMTALRLARAATGRDKIVIFEGAYNGHSDGTLAKRVLGSDGKWHSEPVSPGVPMNVARDCIVVEYGSDESLEIIRQQAHEIGAVLVEPVQSRNLELQPIEFLRSLRKLTEELDVALIFDEMISGFRVHPAGIQGLWGIQADLATYGKIIGGGTAIGAVAGKSRFMDGIDGGMWQYGDDSYPMAQRTYFGGTFCQHPLSMAGCLATLKELKRQGPELQRNLTQRTTDFAKRLNDWFASEDLALRIIHFGSLFTFRFPGNLEIFYYHLLEKGIYIWEWRACFLSTAHTNDDLDRVTQAIKEAVAEMRSGGFLPEKKAKATRTKAISNPRFEAGKPSHRDLSFSLYFFGNYDADYSQSKYDLLMDACRYGDAHGYESIWLPERHFDAFGGFSPNPSVLAAALARETSHISLRAGSVVLPLHHPLRVAEEWALVDNLSDGRVGLAFAAGWHPNDFALAPQNFEQNREITFEGIETVRTLWSGDSVSFEGGNGKQVDLSIYPRPKQEILPCWLTVVGNPDTYRKAGELGLGILTNLLGQSLEELENNLALYRKTWLEHGHPSEKISIVVLLHTYIEENAESAIETARKPMSAYLASSMALFQKMSDSLPEHLRNIEHASAADKAYVIDKAYERYIKERALIGSPETCSPMAERLLAMGITEIACFLDFGVAAKKVMVGLEQIDHLREQFRATESISPTPSSEAQRQLWLLSRIDEGGNAAYNDPAVVEWRGPINLDALRKTFDQLIERHESLRSTFSEDGKNLLVHSSALSALEWVDLRQEKTPEQAAEAWISSAAAEPADFTNGPLFKPVLLQLGEEHALIVLLAHHIISDGPSMGILTQEMVALYEAEASSKPAKLLEPIPFQNFVRWQSQQRNHAEMAKHLAYWKTTLSPLPQPLELPLDLPRPAVRSWHGKRIQHSATETLGKLIKQAAKETGSTNYMVLHAAFSALLHRWSETADLVIGAASSGRSQLGNQPMVGYGVHLLPVRSTLHENATLQQHLANTRASLLQAYEHQAYPFAWLFEELEIPRDASRAPLINTIFNYERLPASQKLANAEIRPWLPPVTHARVDLTFTINHTGNRFELVADYNADLFNASTIHRLLRSFEVILGYFAQAREQKIDQLPLLSQTDFMESVVQWNQRGGIADYAPIHRPIEAWAKKTPDAAAVRNLIQPEQNLSFAELNRCANQLARHLVSLGASSTQRIAICIEDSSDLLVAMLACLKSGSAYIPLDPNYPSTRLSYVFENAGIDIVISHRALWERLGLSVAHACLLDEIQLGSSKDDENLAETPLPDQCAYVIYTSGSTGKPKGVEVTHKGLANYIDWAVNTYAADFGDGAPILCSTGFDAAVTSLFAPLVAGNATVLIPGEEDLQVLERLAASKEHYSFLKLTPAHLDALNKLRANQKTPNQTLTKFLVLGGEALPAEYLEPWTETTGTVSINEYGPTESVVGCCTFATTTKPQGNVPIGVPIHGTQLFVLDGALNPVLPGMPGELYIGGVGLAQGYLGKPALTAQSFIPNPFGTNFAQSGSRLYKTGDLVRLGYDGNLTFLGRLDAQIKINGFRVEPGEIESAILAHADIHQVTVIKRELTSGQAALVAFVVTAKRIDESALKAWLKDRLPAYMIPARLVQIEQIPLTSHGKVDRDKLARIELQETSRATTGTATPPGNEIERRIAQVWASVLRRDDFGTRDNFFDLGGTSLGILEVHNQLLDVLPASCEVIELFRYPTITTLAAFASGNQGITIDREQADKRAERQRAARRQRNR